MENFCGSFLNNVEAWCKGKLNVVGDLKTSTSWATSWRTAECT